MPRIELTVTDWQGIEGIVLADYEDGRLYDFEIISADLTDCEELEYSPTWNQVERELESELYPMYTPIRF